MLVKLFHFLYLHSILGYICTRTHWKKIVKIYQVIKWCPLDKMFVIVLCIPHTLYCSRFLDLSSNFTWKFSIFSTHRMQHWYFLVESWFLDVQMCEIQHEETDSGNQPIQYNISRTKQWRPTKIIHNCPCKYSPLPHTQLMRKQVHYKYYEICKNIIILKLTQTYSFSNY